MDRKFQVILFILIVMLFALIISLLKKKKLSLKYSLLWIVSLFVLLFLSIFQEISIWIAKILGIKTITSLIFSLSLFFLLLIAISLTAIVSKLKDQVHTLVQYSSRLEKRIRDLEKENNNE